MQIGGIQNYYETLVNDEIRRFYSDRTCSMDEILDTACLALNKLPARYIRYSVDASFFINDEDHEVMQQAVLEAVREAAEIVMRKTR